MQRPTHRSTSSSFDRCHVLVVEDEPLLRTALSRILRAEGHVVEEASDGANALNAVRNRPYDVVIIDGMMPGVPGEFVRRAIVREFGKDAPEVVMLATTLAEQKRYEKNGVLTLCKPFRVEQLLQIVDAFRPTEATFSRHSGIYEIDEMSGIRPSAALAYDVAGWTRSANG